MASMQHRVPHQIAASGPRAARKSSQRAAFRFSEQLRESPVCAANRVGQGQGRRLGRDYNQTAHRLPPRTGQDMRHTWPGSKVDCDARRLPFIFRRGGARMRFVLLALVVVGCAPQMGPEAAAGAVPRLSESASALDGPLPLIHGVAPAASVPAPISDAERERLFPGEIANKCAAAIRPSLCANADATKARTCLDGCVAAIDQAQQSKASEAENACEGRLREAAGKGSFKCDLVVTPLASRRKGGGDTAELKEFESATELERTALLADDLNMFMQKGGSVLGDALDKVGGRGAARKFWQALNDVTGPWDIATLDTAFAQSVSTCLQFRDLACTTICNERVRNGLRAEKEAPDLVRKFKFCMVAADSTLEARKLEAYEGTLYREYIGRAEQKCRTTDRCEWLEQFSALRCTYDSP